ncbi:putative agmatine deiminase [Clytia hemisphaerica]|uniref:Uncharacterized protein n=1 Tax=Clytia hemisphaerica TaxID=252671 RepID=A0A7M5WUP2_9CNID
MYSLIILVACLFGTTSAKQLLVLAPPIKANEYYTEKFLDVIPFYVDYVNNVTGKDDVVVVVDEETMSYYKGKIDDSKLIEAHVDDPWLRDVSPPIPSSQVQFTYIGGGGKSEAKTTQDIYDKFIHSLNIKPNKTDLLLDGGNLVNNNEDGVITTKKFLTDNGLNEEQGISELQRLLGVQNVSILTPDEPTLAHADGQAAYVCRDAIYMQKQLEPNNTLYKNELKKGCPGCQIIEVDGFFDDRVYKGGYASSCGVYVNCVVTDDFIYVPTFNHEKDAQALFEFRNNPCNKTVVPIDARVVCEMGGSLRCLSWQTSGTWAKQIITHAAKESHASMVRVSLCSFVVVFSALLIGF